MKSKCSFILKASTALVLALLMLFGTVSTSLAAVVDNADTGAEADVALEGAEVELADTGWNYGGKTILIKPEGNWKQNNEKYRFRVWGGDGDALSAVATSYGSGIYQTTIPTGSHTGGQWVRVNASSTNTIWDYGPDWNGTSNALWINGSSNSQYDYWTTGTTVYFDCTANTSWEDASAKMFTKGANSGTTGGSATTKIADHLYKYTLTSDWDNCGLWWWRGSSASALWNYSAAMDASDATIIGKNAVATSGSGVTNGNGTVAALSLTSISAPSLSATTTTPTYGDSNTVTASGNTLNYSFNGSSRTTTLLSTDAVYNFYVDGSNTAAQSGTTKTYDASGLAVGSHTISCKISSALTGLTSSAGSVSITVADNTTPSIDTFTIGGAASKTLNIGETATLASTTSNTSNSVTYSTTSDAISISGTTVTALKPVTSATITATLVDGSTYTKTVTVKVNTPTVSLTTTSAQSLNVNQTHTNTATGSTIGSAATGTISYSVGGSTNISVNSSGEVTGLKPTSTAQTMTATYTVTCGGQTTTATKTCNYTVKTPVLTNSAATSMNVDATQTLSASVTNTTGTPTYTWTVTNGTGTASLSSGTTLKALTPGTVTATVTAKFNDSYSLTKDATITIATPTITASGITVAKGNSKSISASTSNPTGLTLAYALKTAVSGVSISGNTVSVTQGCTASSATVTVSAENSAGTVVATKDVTVTIQAPSLDVKDGSTSVKNGTVYTTKGTNKILTVAPNFTDDLTVKSSNTSIATVSLSGNTLTITPNAKGTCKVSVSTNSGYTPTAAIFPGASVFADKFDLAGVGAVATQTATFTVNVAESDSNKFITYATSSWTGTVYAWYNNAWHTMTKVGTDNASRTVWALNVGSSYPSPVVFSSQNSWNTGGNGLNQTVDCSVSASANSFYENGQSNGKRNVGSYATTITIPQLVADNMTVQVDETKNLNVTIVNNTTPAKTTYTSAETSKATVSSTGAVTGVEPNGTTVTVRAWAAKPHDNWANWITDNTTQSLLSGTATSTITVTADPKTITYQSKYSDNGTTWNNATNTQGTFTVKNGSTSVTSGASLPYNTTLTLTATPASGYAVEGVYWSIDNGSTWTKVDCTVSGGVYTNNTFNLNNNYLLEARFIKVYKLSAFDSYEMKNNQVTFVTAPPKSITIKHTDAHGDATTYTYSYDGTVAAGNPYSPDGTNPAALPIASGKYGQGNYIQYYAGDEITMTYSAMASSELLKGVFYNNDTEYYINKPTTTQYKSHDYTAAHTLYMNSSYYDSVPGSFDGVTVDQDSHSIKFTGTQDYKNIDVEIGTKRKVYFSDYTNAVITSKNVDDYYYDNEPLSVTGDQLKVAAAKSDTQTNSITANNVKFYRATESGGKGTELTADEKTALGLSITGSTSTSSSSADGAALTFNGNMPAYDLYIDLNMENSYTIKLGTKIVSDLGGTATRLASKATVKINTLSAVSNADVTTSSTSVTTGTTATLSVTGLTSGYMFVGWYWGDASGPDYNKGFISDKQSLSYAPKKGGIIWAVGTKELFINGSKYITGKSTDWYSENNEWKNQQMSFDPDRGTQGSYYWEITDTMYASAGNDFKYISSNSGDTGGSNTEGKYFKGDDNYYYWCNNEDSKHGKAFFQLLDTATGYNSREVWKSVYSFLENADGTTHGKILKRDMNQAGDTDYQRLEGQGFIDFAESRYSGYSSPLRIYLDAATKDLDVVATAIHSNLYVSNGYDVGSTLKTDAVTVQPVVDGVVKTSGQTGYFAINTQGSGWNPDAEGHVSHYIPQKKGATVRITKQAGGSDKIAAFLIYDIDNRTVRAERNLTKGTTANSKTPYYFDLTLANERQNLYIVPIVEEAGAKVTITFDATQLNRAQWGDIVTAYTWYTGTNNNGLGAYPGQPMIPSDDMSTWTTTFAATKGGNELTGITFTNYVDGIHSWLGCSGVMGEVSDHKTGTATGGIINVYNHVDSGTNGEYSRTNYKAQTYDYHEPIALYNRYKNEDSVNITFQMKDGNSSLISWRHTEFAPENIISGTWGHTLNWEYLTNAKGDQYIDMNGNPLGANNKPTATFYVASKGQVVYNDSRMDYVFHGGHNYQMKGYDAAYSDPTGGADRGSYTKTALPSGQWSSDITYGGAADLDMKYAVQWYVYDAQGNYITTVLSAGIADLSSNNTDTYIAKQLEDLGYAVDGKSVAICYDKPRYMYGDWSNVTNSASNINSGPNFDAYRFEGQWIAAAQTDTVKVHVGVGMMTDSGEVLADSNTAAYGNASASLVSGVTFGKPNYAITANDGSWAQTAATDAKLNGIALNASATNFIGWYYYDANTGEFTKATYASNEGFRPNYTNKDVTYYAIYRAAAVYNYIYQGREGERIYSAAGEDLKEAEMSAQGGNKVVYENHSADVLAKLPVGIGIFKKNIDFSAASVASWTKDNNTQYILKLSGFRVTSPEYTLTAHYKDASGDLVTITDSAVYNGKAINLTTGLYHDSKNNLKPGGTAVTSYYPGFIGWYEYDASNGKVGELLSTQANYGMRLTKNQHIIAQYKDDGKTLPSDNWRAFIDENEVNKELTTKDSGVFYNDTIVRVRNGSDVKAELPTGAKIGVIVVCNNKTTETINGYTEAQLTTLATSVAPGKTMGTKKGLSITNMQATGQTSFNRTDIAVRADYAKNLGANYCVYAYIFDGSNYHFSAPSEVKTYE